jgi:hypothetical protein
MAFFRVCAKVAFNCLCHLKGAEFVLQECFDPIRKWILAGGENAFTHAVSFAESPLTGFLDNAFPPYSHKALFFTLEDRLLSTISFYGGYSATVVEMCTGIKADIFDGFICDWRHSAESRLHDYVGLLNGET